jgi:hypothetical protein
VATLCSDAVEVEEAVEQIDDNSSFFVCSIIRKEELKRKRGEPKAANKQTKKNITT